MLGYIFRCTFTNGQTSPRCMLPSFAKEIMCSAVFILPLLQTQVAIMSSAAENASSDLKRYNMCLGLTLVMEELSCRCNESTLFIRIATALNTCSLATLAWLTPSPISKWCYTIGIIRMLNDYHVQVDILIVIISFLSSVFFGGRRVADS